jgi:hypothetical protein
LTCKRTFTEETPIAQYTDGGFLAGFGNNGESDLAGLQVKYRVCGISLGEDGLLFRKDQSLPALADGSKECLGVELPVALGIQTWTRRIPRALRFPSNRRRDGDFR